MESSRAVLYLVNIQAVGILARFTPHFLKLSALGPRYALDCMYWKLGDVVK